ncbi:hypothetical protein D1872_320340 [compost metagenome]
MPLHFLPDFVVQGRLQFIDRHARQLAVQQIHDLLHLRHGQSGRNRDRFVLDLPRARHNDRHRRGLIERQQLKMP